jgi:hypothetical protein
MLELAFESARQLGQASLVAEYDALGRKAAGDSWESGVRALVKRQLHNDRMILQHYGITPVEMRATLLPIVKNPVDHPPIVPYRHDWSESCRANLGRFGFPFSCGAKLEQYMLSSRHDWHTQHKLPARECLAFHCCMKR